MTPYRRQVFYYETDRMGFVHNSNYLRIFEEARLDHMQQSGLSYPKMEEDGIIIPQTDAFIKYETPARYGDSLSCLVRLEECNGVRLKYAYTLLREADGKLLAQGWTRHCFLDSSTLTPMSIKKREPSTYEQLLAALTTET
ncbi:MAG: acyl-CoA thioesterase [Oscillospiraceae bacterium]|nr:acyl-CoA thioesterase [Oscillospiraceae bacterium]